MGVATLAVVVLTLDYGRLPWVALVLAFSFGTYGLAKKSANVGAVESLALETTLIAPVRGGVRRLAGRHRPLQLRLPRRRPRAAAHARPASSPPIPLICFGAAATRVSMVTLGLLQYLAPILQFALGVLYFHEDMPAGRWAGFMLVWVALVSSPSRPTPPPPPAAADRARLAA